jgi:hypothetical protein
MVEKIVPVSCSERLYGGKIGWYVLLECGEYSYCRHWSEVKRLTRGSHK